MSLQYASAGEALLHQAEGLAEWITDKQYEEQPELMERFGPPGRYRTRQDSLYSLNYLGESVLVNSPGLFMHYVSWLKVLLEGYHVSSKDLNVNLMAMRKAIETQFDHPDKDRVLHVLDTGAAQAETDVEQASWIRDDQPLAEAARLYLQALLDGKRQEAMRLVNGLLDRGTGIKEVYRYIFQPVQYEVGRLWHTGEIQVAEEHYCTAATQAVISSLYPRWMGEEAPKGKRLVAACVGSELHEIGIRMVTDMFEMEGWDTYYLGANVPDRSLIQAIKDYKADVVAVSATMTFHIHLVKDLVAKIRADRELGQVKILVGGLPFNLDHELWRKIGADGFAQDAETTVACAEKLVGIFSVR